MNQQAPSSGDSSVGEGSTGPVSLASEDDSGENYDTHGELPFGPFGKNGAVSFGDAEEDAEDFHGTDQLLRRQSSSVSFGDAHGTEENDLQDTCQINGTPLHENNNDITCVDEEDQGMASADRGDGDVEADQLEPAAQSPSRNRKKVKHRHCKAAIMMCIIWGITLIFVSTALGMDWFNLDIDQEADCILCEGNGLDFGYDELIWPTRQPSPTYEVTNPFNKVDPPPSNLAGVCAPSIRLQNSDYNTGGNIENCIRACLPAVCCLVNNAGAQEGLLSMLGSLGLAENQASAYLSTIEDCYSGDDTLVCDAYNEWCATLYDLDYVLEESLPGHFFDTCYRKQENGGGIITASSRAFNPRTADGDCGEICSPLACCYENAYQIDSTIMRKRDRHHNYGADSGSYNLEYSYESRRRAEVQECQNFVAQGSVNAQICDAYSPFCNPSTYSRNSDLSYPSFEPSGTPTQMQSTSPSKPLSNYPSISPTMQQSAPISIDSSLEPSGAPTQIRSFSPTAQSSTTAPLYSVSSSPSSESSDMPTQMQSLSPSTQSTYHPSILPSRPSTPAPLASATSYQSSEPSDMPSQIQSSSPSTQSSNLVPSTPSPTRTTSDQQSTYPTLLTSSPSSFSSHQNSITNTSSSTLTNSTNLYVTLNSSSPSSLVSRLPTQRPSATQISNNMTPGIAPPDALTASPSLQKGSPTSGANGIELIFPVGAT